MPKNCDTVSSRGEVVERRAIRFHHRPSRRAYRFAAPTRNVHLLLLPLVPRRVCDLLSRVSLERLRCPPMTLSSCQTPFWTTWMTLDRKHVLPPFLATLKRKTPKARKRSGVSQTSLRLKSFTSRGVNRNTLSKIKDKRGEEQCYYLQHRAKYRGIEQATIQNVHI